MQHELAVVVVVVEGRKLLDEDEVLFGEGTEAEAQRPIPTVQERPHWNDRRTHITGNKSNKITTCRGVCIIWTAMELGFVEFWWRDLNLNHSRSNESI